MKVRELIELLSAAEQESEVVLPGESGDSYKSVDEVVTVYAEKSTARNRETYFYPSDGQSELGGKVVRVALILG